MHATVNWGRQSDITQVTWRRALRFYERMRQGKQHIGAATQLIKVSAMTNLHRSWTMPPFGVGVKVDDILGSGHGLDDRICRIHDSRPMFRWAGFLEDEPVRPVSEMHADRFNCGVANALADRNSSVRSAGDHDAVAADAAHAGRRRDE